MAKFIDPITGVEPEVVVKYSKDGSMKMFATSTYTTEMLREYAQSISDQVDETLFAILAGLRGYVIPVRCRDCRFVYIEDGAIKRHWCDRKERGKQHSFVCHPQGFCAWGEPRENPCRNADEGAAAFADAPTLGTAREPNKTPVFELGA